MGLHNAYNGLAAIASAHHVKVAPEIAMDALSQFQGVKRRLEILGKPHGITIYDDFAHHPTAIKATLEGLRKKVKQARVIAIVEPRSNTMKMGVHADRLDHALQSADLVFVLCGDGIQWDVRKLFEGASHIRVFDSVANMESEILAQAQSGDHLVFMSNGSFGGIQFSVQRQLSSRG